MNCPPKTLAAIRHLADCARLGYDEGGTPFLNSAYSGGVEAALLTVDKFLADAEAENVQRETSRAPVVSGSMR